MKKTKAATKKVSTGRRNGARARNGSNSRPVFAHPKTETEAAIQGYADLFNFAPLGYVTFDRVGRIEDVNFAATRMLGRVRGYLLGNPFAVCVASEDAQLFLHHLLECRFSDGAVVTDLHLKRRSGEVFPVQLSSTASFSSMKDGALLYQTAIVDLTERKRAEETIRHSELRYRTLFDLIPAAVYACDASGKILEFNQHATELWGREPKRDGAGEKFCGSQKLYYPDGRPMRHQDCPMARALRGETLEDHELEIIVERNTGERRNAIAAPRVLTNDRGKTIGAINCLYDITERKRAEEALAEVARQQSALYTFVQRRSEAKSLPEIYSAGIEVVMDALSCDRASLLLFDQDQVMRFVAWRGLSDRYRKAVEGHSPWKPGAKKVEPICLPDIATADLPKPLKRTIQNEGIGATAFIPLVGDSRLIGKFMVYYNRSHVFSAREIELAKNIAGQVALGIERQIGEEALRESEERLRAIVSQATVGMARCDLTGRFVFVNERFCQMLGYNTSELIGKNIRKTTHPGDVSATMAAFGDLVKKAKPYQVEKRFVRKDGSMMWANVSASPVRDTSGKPRSAVAVMVDISPQKKAQVALEKANRLLEVRVRDQTAELRLANAELRNEIKRRKGLEGEILEISDREQERLGQELHDGICQHLTAVAFMARSITTRLKNHRVIEVGDVEKIAELINEAAADTRNISRALHRLEANSAELERALQDLVNREIWKTPCRLEFDRSINLENDATAAHLYRIAREAVINANKHAQARQIVVKLAPWRNGILLSVTDDGVGLRPNGNQSRGLGFHIMSYRARIAGGRLSVDHPHPRGTRITCYLPGEALKPGPTRNGSSDPRLDRPLTSRRVHPLPAK